jgi:hypothetical protein
MPQPRKYPSNAARQKAYRERKKRKEREFTTLSQRIMKNYERIARDEG